MSEQHERHCIGLLSAEDRTSANLLKAGHTDVKIFEDYPADALLAQIRINDPTQKDLSQTGVMLEESNSLPENKTEGDANPYQPTLLSWLARQWQAFVNSFSRQPELKIWQRRDRQGNQWWVVYDPITHQSTQLTSEDEVRIWIEQSYTHRFKRPREIW